MAALKRVTLKVGALTAAHVPLQLVDRRRLLPAHDVEGNGLMGATAEAFHLKVKVAGIERIAQRRRGLGRTLKGRHTLVPGFASELIGFLARFGRALG
jgi:hypothetical protein